MELHMTAPLLALERGQVLSLHNAAGTRIVPRTGRVWVTQENSARDDIVGPGDVLVVARRGRTVIQALQSTLISLRDGADAANDPT
jgi:hypothetical protein